MSQFVSDGEFVGYATVQIPQPRPGKWRGELRLGPGYSLVIHPSAGYEIGAIRRAMTALLFGVRWKRLSDQ